MSGLSTTGESLLLTTLMTGRYVSLHFEEPGDTGANEITGTPYVRQSSTWEVTGSNPSTIANTTVIQFPTATDNWGYVTHFGLWSAATGGTFLGGWPVNISKAVGAEDTARWDVGKLQIATDDAPEEIEEASFGRFKRI